MKYYSNKLMMLVCATAFSVTACSSSNSFSDPVDFDTPSEAPNPVPAQGTAKTFITTADGVYSLSQGEVKLYNGVSMAPTTIELDLNKKYQTIDGFGYAITYSSCYNLMQMNPEARLALLKRIYSTTEGYGVSYARISLGCNDFSSTEYTYCDKKGSEADPISNFALYSDENDYVIPVLKEILAINPNLKIIAAPWTCPKWMKVTDLNTKNPKDSWTDGHLNPDYREAYAKYFVKFINVMKEKGIKAPVTGAIPVGLEVTTRETDTPRYYFYQNRSTPGGKGRGEGGLCRCGISPAEKSMRGGRVGMMEGRWFGREKKLYAVHSGKNDSATQERILGVVKVKKRSVRLKPNAFRYRISPAPIIAPPEKPQQG